MYYAGCLYNTMYIDDLFIDWLTMYSSTYGHDVPRLYRCDLCDP